MSAHYLLNDIQFYHGTERPIYGDTIKPGYPRSFDKPAPGGEESYFSGKYAYATTDKKLAEEHASGSRFSQVLEVRPLGIPRRDPEDTNEHPTLFMSRQGWKIHH